MTTVELRVARREDLAVVRVGRLPDPLAFVPPALHTWAGRFDDPHRLWRTLYAAEDEYGAWVEVLGRFRAHADTSELAGAVEVEAADREPVTAGTVSLTWIGERGVARELRTAADADMLRYPSRYGGPSVCFAIFEPIDGLPRIGPVGASAPADPRSRPLERAMALHGLTWSD